MSAREEPSYMMFARSNVRGGAMTSPLIVESLLARIDRDASALKASQPRTITTAEEIRELPALTIVVYDDTATGGLLQTYVVPDDGTVMFKDSGEFHLMTFAGDYIDAKDMPLPLTAVYEAGA